MSDDLKVCPFCGAPMHKSRAALPTRIMRGFAAAKRDAGPSIVRNLLHIWGMMLIVGVLFFGGLFTFMIVAVGLMNAGDWLLGPLIATNFVTWYVMPTLMVISFLALVWLLYWRSKSDRSGI